MRSWRPAGWAAAAILLSLSLLPVVNWIPGGHVAPWYGLVSRGWLNGAVIVLGGAIVLAISSRHVPGLWRDGLLAPLRELWQRHTATTTAVIAAVAAAIYMATALVVFDGRPLHIDEIAQALQGTIFADGEVWRPAPAYPEFFSQMHLVDGGGRTYAHFPPGGPALLALGVLAGAPWIIVPLCGALAVLAFAHFARHADDRAGVSLGATLLFAFAPFMAFMSGTHMNHVPALMFIVAAAAALAHLAATPRGRPALAALVGTALGAAATIRPVDAFAFALPAAAWLMVLAIRDRTRWIDVAAAGVGIAVPGALLFWFNAQTTGAPLLFGYEVLWGREFGLGFHDAPWGPPHTPARGLELLNLYFLRLGTYLLETPVPAVLPAIGAIGLARRLTPADRYLLASSALLLALHFAYWHDGFHLGPRFMIPLLPALALWTARFLPAVRDQVNGAITYRLATYACVVALSMAVLSLIPSRARQYAGGMATMRWNADMEAEAAGISGALVLVRESWGSQIMARLWALGVPRTLAQRLYENVDTCTLDEGVTALESSGIRGAPAAAALVPLMRDSARVVPSRLSPDETERMVPGSTYGVRCSQRVLEDRAGFTALAPLMLSGRGGNIYARDLHARDTLLLRQHPDRPVYLLRPPDSEMGTPPRFSRLSRDSLWNAWSAGHATSVLVPVPGSSAGQRSHVTPTAGGRL